MNTTDTVLLIILTSILSLFFLLCIAAVILVIRTLSGVRHAVKKAEAAIDSVESAADVFKDAHGKMTTFKLIKNILDVVQKR